MRKGSIATRKYKIRLIGVASKRAARNAIEGIGFATTEESPNTDIQMQAGRRRVGVNRIWI